jgi:hypothetical protein
MDSYNVADYFSFLSIAPALVWLVIFTVIGFFIRNNNRDKPHYKYYLWNLYAKLGFSLLFALFYLLYYGGGDTTAYYDGAVALNNLFFKNPLLYFDELTSPADFTMFTATYDLRTGYPPGWIYREPEGWMISRLMSLLSFFTLKSYFAMTVIMAFITSVASWKLYELVRQFRFNNDKVLAFGILLLPSVNFWCAGVSKDTVVFIAVLFLVYHAFHIISNELKANIWNYVFAIIAALVISQIRSFILAAIALPMLVALTTRIIKFLGGSNMFVVVFRTVVLIGGLAVAGQSLVATNEESFLAQNAYLQEAAIIQQDFEQNTLYGDKKYSIGEIEFTPLGLLRAAPAAIIAGLYRPFPWEALSPALLMNGLEAIMFLYFTWLLFRRDFFRKWNLIRTHEFLVFCLIFILVIAFMTGLTSGLYGVLVRLRAPLLPFLFVLLTLDLQEYSKNTMKSVNSQP